MFNGQNIFPILPAYNNKFVHPVIVFTLDDARKKHNLLNVCSKCHDRIHAKEITVGGYKQSSNGIILEIKNEPGLDDGKYILEDRVRELRNKGVSYNKILEKIGEEYPNEKISVYRIKKIVASK